MPAETVLVLAIVIAMFATLMVVLGVVWIWTEFPQRSPEPARSAATRSKATTAQH